MKRSLLLYILIILISISILFTVVGCGNNEEGPILDDPNGDSNLVDDPDDIGEKEKGFKAELIIYGVPDKMLGIL